MIAGVVRLLEVNGMLWFDVPWIRIIAITASVLIIGAIIFGRDKNRPGLCPFSGICPFNEFCPFGHRR